MTEQNILADRFVKRIEQMIESNFKILPQFSDEEIESEIWVKGFVEGLKSALKEYHEHK